jgi:hypothetical protein
MNLRTVEERYQGRRAERMAEESTFFRYEPVDAASPVIQAIQCWMYLCAEGDVPESDLLKIITNSGNGLMHSIIQDLPECEAAHGGLRGSDDIPHNVCKSSYRAVHCQCIGTVYRLGLDLPRIFHHLFFRQHNRKGDTGHGALANRG